MSCTRLDYSVYNGARLKNAWVQNELVSFAQNLLERTEEKSEIDEKGRKRFKTAGYGELKKGSGVQKSVDKYN